MLKFTQPTNRGTLEVDKRAERTLQQWQTEHGIH